MINICCPQCTHEFDPFAGLPAGAKALSAQQLEIVTILAQKPSEFMQVERLAQILYADRIDGGPLDFRTIIQKQIHSIRQRAGDIVETRRGSGYRLKGTSAMVAEEVTGTK